MKTRVLIALATVCVLATTAQAGIRGFLKGVGCGEPVATSCAPASCANCTPEVVKEKYTKTYYKPGTKKICIPPIKFPWMKCNEFGCPEVKCVRTFEKDEIECERCVVKWKLDDPEGGCAVGGGKFGCAATPATGCAPTRLFTSNGCAE